jgi:hypothetical protein
MCNGEATTYLRCQHTIYTYFNYCPFFDEVCRHNPNGLTSRHKVNTLCGACRTPAIVQQEREMLKSPEYLKELGVKLDKLVEICAGGNKDLVAAVTKGMSAVNVSSGTGTCSTHLDVACVKFVYSGFSDLGRGIKRANESFRSKTQDIDLSMVTNFQD